jgi:N-acetylneuraminic acid mutarotase
MWIKHTAALLFYLYFKKSGTMSKSSLGWLLLLPFILSFLDSSRSADGNWQVVNSKNPIESRSECGLASVDGKLYLLGGDGGKALPVASFDPNTLTWTNLALAPSVMHHFQAVAWDKKIYVLDAFSSGGFPNQDPAADLFIYDTEKNKWQTGKGLEPERRRAGAGAAEYQGKLYLVAGIQHGHSSGTTNMFDVYDPKTNSWTVLPDAPHIRDHCSAAVIHDKLYAVGGRNSSYHEPNNFMAFFSHTVLEVDCYDFKTGKWTTLSAKLPLGSGGGAVVNLANRLYYIGGERATATERNAPRKNTFYLDPLSQDQWKEADSMHMGRNGMPAAVLDNKIYVAGGSGGGPGGPPPNGQPGNPMQQPMPNHVAADSMMRRDAPRSAPQNDLITIEVFSLK